MPSRSKFAFLCMAGVTSAWPALAVVPATPQAVPLVSAADVRDADTLPVRSEVSAMVGMSKDLGRVADRMAMPQLTLVLKRPAARQAVLDHLVTAQLSWENPALRQWVKPEELFTAFGQAPEDITIDSIVRFSRPVSIATGSDGDLALVTNNYVAAFHGTALMS